MSRLINNNPVEYRTLLPIAQKYDYFLIDLWGVLHDGEKLYEGAKEAIENLYLMGKHIVFLSNAPKRNVSVISHLNDLGIKPEYYTGVLSSGEVCYRQCLAAPDKKKFYYIGADGGRSAMQGTGFTEVTKMEQADLLFVSSPANYSDRVETLIPELKKAKALGLPMLCPNPDRVIQRQDGQSRYCPGAAADIYMGMGGKVFAVGKPYAAIYKMALQMFGENIDRSKVVMIDDGLITGIDGANRMGIDSVLVLGGILQIEKLPLEEALAKAKIYPTATLPRLSFTEQSIAASLRGRREETGERII